MLRIGFAKCPIDGERVFLKGFKLNPIKKKCELVKVKKTSLKDTCNLDPNQQTRELAYFLFLVL